MYCHRFCNKPVNKSYFTAIRIEKNRIFSNRTYLLFVAVCVRIHYDACQSFITSNSTANNIHYTQLALVIYSRKTIPLKHTLIFHYLRGGKYAPLQENNFPVVDLKYFTVPLNSVREHFYK